ncbi:class I SAM-dependent methyltransferase [Iamia sp.]|uniref:class I SAM-dependent methyltransferase n=1 Tax=Iamia sp. TaxID=2722710 RepID=UPI002BCD1D8E|nr:methyltransferase domain-containing protein [Iamia sp.]HXH56037.1 methyltransferase domain-containing protein [Iamia sp.]
MVHWTLMALCDALFARFYDPLLAPMEEAGLQIWRAELLAELAGTVVEIGAGTGANLAHYPAAVERLILTEPEPGMLAQLRPRLDQVRSEIEVTAQRASASSLPLGDDEADAVVTTLVLCSVPDPGAVLTEVRRVLRPGGRLVFLEHVAAEGRPDRLRWQRRLDHVWPHIAGGCRLTRDTRVAIEDAGFTVEALARESARKAPPFIRPMIRGHALAPA